MKQVLTIFSFLALTAFSYAQPPEYKDLRILFADKNYTKLVKEAEKYTLKDKTKKDILPYIWMAKGLDKISLSGTDDPEFKNAFKNGIKYLGKGMKYDIKYNAGATIEEEREFIDGFQMGVFERVNNELTSGSYKRAFGWAIKYQKVTQNVIGTKYMQGACKYFDGDKPSARELWKQCDALLKDIEGIENWSEADQKFLKMGVLYSAAALKKGRQDDKAKMLVGKVAQWYENDPDWQSDYDAIVNGVE